MLLPLKWLRFPDLISISLKLNSGTKKGAWGRMVPPGYSSGETTLKVMKSRTQLCPYLAVLPGRQQLYFGPREAFLGYSLHSWAGEFGAKISPDSLLVRKVREPQQSKMQYLRPSGASLGLEENKET
jgi:hypothetical protein